MKRCFLLVLVILLLLCGCGAPSAAPDRPEGQAADLTQANVPFVNSQASLRQDYVETAAGIYYTVPKTTTNGKFGGQIWFLPKDGTQPFLLCGKPNCVHMGDYCDAWGGYELAMYGGKLYTQLFDLEFKLIRMNPDGTDHETVCELPTARYPDGSWEYAGTCFAAGDQLFVAAEINLARPFEQQRSHFWLIDLQTGETHEAFADLNEQYHLQAGTMRYVDGKLYCQLDVFLPDGARELWMGELDLDTEAWRMLFRIEDYFPVWAVYGDTLYYLVEDTGFREYDLNTGKTVDRGLPVADAKWATFDEDYIYLMGHDPAFDAWAEAAKTQTPYSGPNKSTHTLYILTRDYVLVDQIYLENGENLYYVTDDTLYFCAGDYGADARLEKAKFGSGNLQLLPLE